MRFHHLTHPAAQELGVRGKTLHEDEAYVFAPLSHTGRFVMDGVPFDLDIVFLDDLGRVLASRRMIAETGGSEIPLGSSVAVEALPGVMDRAGLQLGDRWPDALEGI